MKRILKYLWDLPIYVWNVISLVAASLLASMWRYSSSYARLWLALRDFGGSMRVWFRVFLAGFRGGEIEPITGPQISMDTFDPSSAVSAMPDWFTDAKGNFLAFFSEFFDLSTFGAYNLWLFDLIYRVLFYGVYLVFAAWLLGYMIKDNILTDKENPVGSISRPLEWFIVCLKRVVVPTYDACRDFVWHVWRKKWLVAVLASVWLCNLNMVTIALQVISSYFYFMSSFNISVLPARFLHLLLDLFLMISGLPIIVWLILGAIVFYVRWRAKALDELRHMDAKNCGFLKGLSYILLIVGRPGLGKTTLMTSFALYYVNIFKQEALDILYELELLFPAFPFGKLRRALEERMESRLIKNVPSCDQYIDTLRSDHELTPAPCRLFDYDYELFGLEKNAGNRMEDLFEVLSDYSKAYWIYSCENPSISNYPIRFDGEFDDSKYLKRWNGDFYDKDPRKIKETSRYSHVYDKDITRMGRKIDPNGPYNGSFGPGIFTDMEMGKSRGNQNTNEIFRADDDETNPKNDLYVLTCAYIRHANTTVRHKCFCRLISDEQRPETVGAAERELCQVVTITDKSELKLAVPGFKWLDKLYDRVYKPFKDFYMDNYCNVRGDMILSVFLLKLAVSAISGLYRRLYNNYGYYVLTLKIQDGRAFGNAKDSAAADEIHEFYLMVKQVYSDRYLTDADKTFFTKEQLEAQLGLLDLPCYGGLEMTEEEMKMQKDYTIMRMMQRTYGNVDAKGLSKQAKEALAYDEDIVEL